MSVGLGLLITKAVARLDREIEVDLDRITFAASVRVTEEVGYSLELFLQAAFASAIRRGAVRAALSITNLQTSEPGNGIDCIEVTVFDDGACFTATKDQLGSHYKNTLAHHCRQISVAQVGAWMSVTAKIFT